MPDNPPIPHVPLRRRLLDWRTALAWSITAAAVTGFLLVWTRTRPGGGVEEQSLGGGVKVRVLATSAHIVYGDGSRFPPDGLAMVVVTAEDDKSHPQRLDPVRPRIGATDWPVVVFVNASGFDATGAPVVIRRAADGKVLYREEGGSPSPVRLSVARRDGDFDVYPYGRAEPWRVGEREWVEKFLRVPYEVDPKELEKLSDEELARRGLQRLPATNQQPKTKAEDGKGKGPPLRILVPERTKPKDKKE